MKSPSMSPPNKYLIPNQDNNILNIKKDQSFPPHLAKFPTVFKSIIKQTHDHNITEDCCNDSTDTSHNYEEDYVKNMKVIHNKDIYDEYQNWNSSDHTSN